MFFTLYNITTKFLSLVYLTIILLHIVFLYLSQITHIFCWALFAFKLVNKIFAIAGMMSLNFVFFLVVTAAK